MKTFTILFLSLFGLLTFQSCSSDDNDHSPRLQETEIFVDAYNASISSIVIKADDKTVFTSTEINNKTSFTLKEGYPKTVSIEATAIVDKDDIKAELRYGEVIGGDGLSTSKENTKEKPIKGETLSLSGTMKFSYD